MAIVKSHVCNMCGGLLDIDLDRQMYICPFCGVQYDYDYFREDNVLDIATRALYRGEFGSAKEAYEFIIKKDPHSFEALRGLFLCSCKWRSISGILNKEKVSISSTNPELSFAIENCLPEHKDMFVNIRDILNILKEFRKNRTEIYRLDGEIESTTKRLHAIELAKEENRTRFTDSFTRLLGKSEGNPLMIPLIYIFILILIGFIYSCWAIGWGVLVIALSIITAVVIVYNFKKTVINKSLEAAKVPVTEKLENLKKDLEAKKQYGDDLLKQYHEKSKAAVLDDRRFHKAPENVSESEGK